MNRIVQFGVSAVAAAAIGIGAGSGIAAAFDGEDEVTGPDADRARAAAVQAVPGGTRVEVHLDRDFRVLDTEPADGDGG